jgi:hypothetical protein
MSIPSASCLVTMGAIVDKAWETSRHDRPAMLPESSIKSVVSKVARKEYGSSPPRVVVALGDVADDDDDAAGGAGAAACGRGTSPISSEIWIEGGTTRVGPVAVVGDGV